MTGVHSPSKNSPEISPCGQLSETGEGSEEEDGGSLKRTVFCQFGVTLNEKDVEYLVFHSLSIHSQRRYHTAGVNVFHARISDVPVVENSITLLNVGDLLSWIL